MTDTTVTTDAGSDDGAAWPPLRPPTQMASYWLCHLVQSGRSLHDRLFNYAGNLIREMDPTPRQLAKQIAEARKLTEPLRDLLATFRQIDRMRSDNTPITCALSQALHGHLESWLHGDFERIVTSRLIGADAALHQTSYHSKSPLPRSWTDDSEYDEIRDRCRVAGGEILGLLTALRGNLERLPDF